MPSILPKYEYDIFISYRHNDNKQERWVTEFVNVLKGELDATMKDKVAVYFDENVHDGLHDTHVVDKSLEKKLKCLIFIPIVSMTYCDTNSFAWQNEFIPFIERATNDGLGMNIQLANGNVASRILPVKIHEIDPVDEKLIQDKIGNVLRSIDFIYQAKGVNRPLRLNELNPEENARSLNFRNQINKLANAIKELIDGANAAKDNTSETDERKDETSENNAENFVDKVRHRDLLKVGLVYAIFSLVLWKTIALTASFLSLPAVIADVAILVLVALLPVALVFAWFFERGPTGFIMTNSLAAKNNPYTSNQKKPLTGNIAILSLLVIMLVLYFVPQAMVSNNLISKSQLLENKSIAVLYFDNMSGDPEQEYFSDGITEEIIARLTKIEGIRVISRTSTRVYKGQPLNLKKIAKELNVSAVLEGSFRKVGDKIKVTAQLIDAETDEHIWAETFTRELKDVFLVQSEIAHEIAEKFEVDITPETDIKISEIPTKNLEAYEYFLRGKHIALTQYYFIGDSIYFLRAKNMYESAIRLDSQFAEAYAGLADLYDAKRNENPKDFSEKEDSLRLALSLKAYSISPNSSWVNNARAFTYLNRKDRQLDSGFYHLRRAWELDPNDSYNIFCLATFYSVYLGLYEQSGILHKETLNLNPLDAITYGFLGFENALVGNMDNTFQYWSTSSELRGTSNEDNVIVYFIFKKNYDEARKLITNRTESSPITKYYEALLLGAQGNFKEAIEIIRKNELTIGVGTIDGMRLFLVCGLKDEAIDWLNKRPHNFWNHYLSLKNHYLWDPYRQDADFIELLDSAKVKYDNNLAKYGPFVDEFLRKKEE